MWYPYYAGWYLSISLCVTSDTPRNGTSDSGRSILEIRRRRSESGGSSIQDFFQFFAQR